MKKKRIYLDTAAATPLDPRVRDAINRYQGRHFGNPSSIYEEGVTAYRAIETARRGVASILGAAPAEVVFLSGGTESNNLAILGVGEAVGGGHIVTSAIEHPSILEPCRHLESRGFAVTYLRPDSTGAIEPQAVGRALRSDTILVSIGYANNEIGVVQPIKAIAKAIRHFKDGGRPCFHTDACQAPRFLEIDVRKLGVDLMTLNGAKIYGPRGSGCLYVGRGVSLTARQYGGGQEAGRRSGSENAAAILGFAAALRLCVKKRGSEVRRLSALRDYFIDKLLRLPGVVLNGSASGRLPNNVNVSVAGTEAEQLVIELDAAGVACSAGSACSSHVKEESYVIMNLGRSRAEAQSSVRFTLGRETRRADLDSVLRILPVIIKKLRYHYDA